MSSLTDGIGRARRFAFDRSEAGTARRFAASAFLARVVNAGLGFVTQVLLARWMGEREYGIYAYVWVWLLVLGGIASLGLPVAALKFVPDYRARGDLPGLRAFLRFARGIAIVPSILGSLAAAGLLWAVSEGEGLAYLPVALIALVVLPLYVLTDIQTGIARAYDFVDLGLLADYLVRPALILVAAAAIWALRGQGTALNVMAGTLAATAITAAAQGIFLQRRLRRSLPPGPSREDRKRWIEASWPLFIAGGFSLLLGSVDIIVLKLFVGAEEIALYFAATKIVAVASFVSYGVANTTAHRFADSVAKGDRPALARLATETVRWTFWPTLAIAVVLALLARPLLAIFGPSFADGAPIVAILALGLVAGATVGPADRALAMADHGRATAAIYGLCFLANLVLALLFIPALGPAGAAWATVLATILRAAMLFAATRKRMGLSMFITSRSEAAPGPAAAGRDGTITTSLLTPAEAELIVPEWSELAERALEPNAFFSPGMALAALRNLPEGEGSRILAAWRETDGRRKLVGILPVVRPRGRQFNPFPLCRAQLHATISTPLVDAERPADTLASMLAGLDRAGIAALALPFFRTDGPVASALDTACTGAGFRRLVVERHGRPVLPRGVPGADFPRLTIEPKRRRKLERQRRRLEDEGPVVFKVAADEASITAAVEIFLALEGSGWKGRLGTSLNKAAGGAEYIREGVRAMARAGRFRVATLTAGGKPIAAGLVALAGNRAFYFKVAYDEAYAKLSPGIILTLELSCHLLDDAGVEDTDSLATPDHPLYRGLWLARIPIASEIISTRPGGGPMFLAALWFERARDGLRHHTKPLRDQLVLRVKRRFGQPSSGPATDE